MLRSCRSPQMQVLTRCTVCERRGTGSTRLEPGEEGVQKAGSKAWDPWKQNISSMLLQVQKWMTWHDITTFFEILRILRYHPDVDPSPKASVVLLDVQQMIWLQDATIFSWKLRICSRNWFARMPSSLVRRFWVTSSSLISDVQIDYFSYWNTDTNEIHRNTFCKQPGQGLGWDNIAHKRCQQFASSPQHVGDLGNCQMRFGDLRKRTNSQVITLNSKRNELNAWSSRHGAEFVESLD